MQGVAGDLAADALVINAAVMIVEAFDTRPDGVSSAQPIEIISILLSDWGKDHQSA